MPAARRRTTPLERRSPKTPALAALLGDDHARRFLSGLWPDEHLVVHRPREALPEFFTDGPLASFENLAGQYGGRVQIAGGRGDAHLQFTVSEAPPAYLRQIGLTVFFADDVSPLDARAHEWLRLLEHELGAPRGIGAIRTFASPSSGGLEAHYDQGETFIVQLEGRKRIRLAKNTTYPTLQFIPGKVPADDHYPEFQDGFIEEAPGDGFSVTLEAGSVLFIPRGMWHRTEASSESYSASVCVDVPNPIDVLLPYLRQTLRGAVDWRRPLFGAWGEGSGREAAKAELTRLLSTLGSTLSALSPDALLDAACGAPSHEAPLREGTRLQRVPVSRLKDDGEQLVVTTRGAPGEVRIVSSPSLKAVSTWIAKRRAAFTWGELNEAHPRVNAGELEALVRSLLEVDALKRLDFAATSLNNSAKMNR